MYISSVPQRVYILVQAYIIVSRMVMCKYETTNLNSNRTIISRAGMGEANLSISPSLSFYLKGLILFSS